MKRLLTLLALSMPLAVGPALAFEAKDPPVLVPEVGRGQLPPVAKRIPEQPLVLKDYVEAQGKPGGDLSMLVGDARDVRLMTVYGYTRLVGYDDQFKIVPDLLESLTNEKNRVYTLKLRKGHRWSDGQPFTTEDFRYWWEDVANNPELGKGGPPVEMLVDGKPPKFEIVDDLTVRISWEGPNACFTESLARTAPLFIYRPAHYLKQFHKKYADPDKLQKAVTDSRQANWAALHGRVDVMYGNNNPDLPRLDPWINVTKGSSQRIIFQRNPFFHRVDGTGMQLPYFDRVVLNVASPSLIPSKAGLGESDIQARYLRFADYTFLRQGAKNFGFDVRLWDTGNGGQVVLYPNLHTKDPVWRAVMRDVRVRRALSMAIDREEINEAVYHGMASPSNNTVRSQSPLFKPEYATRFAKLDIAGANKLLDEAGFKKRDARGTRLLPDGREFQVIVLTAGETDEENDVMTLIKETWAKIGVKLFVKSIADRVIFRQHVSSGEAMMVVWPGIESAVPRPESCPREWAPTTKGGLQWPKWGEFYETGGKAGEKCDMPEACELLTLLDKWEDTTDPAEQEKIWRRMIEIHIDQQFSIGIISGVMQPVVVSAALRNVPKRGLYAWHPSAFFGIYHPDLFWSDK